MSCGHDGAPTRGDRSTSVACYLLCYLLGYKEINTGCGTRMDINGKNKKGLKSIKYMFIYVRLFAYIFIANKRINI